MAEAKTQGDILRQWREKLGFSLETAAFGVDQQATLAGIPKKSKKVPRTHASLSRWETGVVDSKDIGISLIAKAYGLTPDQIRKPPPPDGQAPRRSIEVDADKEASVKAFLEALDRKTG